MSSENKSVEEGLSETEVLKQEKNEEISVEKSCNDVETNEGRVKEERVEQPGEGRSVGDTKDEESDDEEFGDSEDEDVTSDVSKDNQEFNDVENDETKDVEEYIEEDEVDKEVGEGKQVIDDAVNNIGESDHKASESQGNKVTCDDQAKKKRKVDESLEGEIADHCDQATVGGEVDRHQESDQSDRSVEEGELVSDDEGYEVDEANEMKEADQSPEEGEIVNDYDEASNGEADEPLEGDQMRRRVEEVEFVDDDEDVVVEEEQDVDEEDSCKEETEEDEEKKAEKKKKEPEERKASNMRFWSHDNRWSDDYEEQRNTARNRKLWDKMDQKWAHDLYVEAEQAPKTKDELQDSARIIESLKNRRRGPRNPRTLKDFVKIDGRRQRDRQNENTKEQRNEGRNRRGSMPDKKGDNVGKKGYDDYKHKDDVGHGERGFRQNRRRNQQDERGAVEDNRGFDRDSRDKRGNRAVSDDDNRGSDHDSKVQDGDRRGDRVAERDSMKLEKDADGRRGDGRMNVGNRGYDKDSRKRNRDRRGESRTDDRDKGYNHGSKGQSKDKPRGFGGREDRESEDRRRNDRGRNERLGREKGFGRAAPHKEKEDWEERVDEKRDEKQRNKNKQQRQQHEPEESSRRRDEEERPAKNERPPRDHRQESNYDTKETQRGRKPRSQYDDDVIDENEKGPPRTTKDSNEIQTKKQEKDVRQNENKRASPAVSAKKWGQLGRGRKPSKPKKTAADFAREAELERRKSIEIAEEETPVVESGRFSNAESGDEGSEVQDKEIFESEPAALSGSKRYSAQRQKPVTMTTAETPMQPVAVSETREPQVIYVAQQGYSGAPVYFSQPPPAMQTQEVNPAMLRPLMIQNPSYPMAPASNTRPGAEYVQTMPAMPPGQYEAGFADTAGMVYTSPQGPQPFQMIPNMQHYISQQVYQPEMQGQAAGGYYHQQGMPTAHPPRQGSPQAGIHTLPPGVQQIVVQQPSQINSSRKRTAAIPIKSPGTEEVKASN